MAHHKDGASRGWRITRPPGIQLTRTKTTIFVELLGIDIGGSGIKGAPVDPEKGTLLAERHRIPTPQPATPQAIAETVRDIARHFNYQGPIGCGFPAAMQQGVALTATNIDQAWIGTSAEKLIEQVSGCPAVVHNDADVAGLAEVHFGAGKDRMGVVFMVTVGTGLGTAIFTDGHLVYNTELGHIPMHGDIAERYAADSVRKQEDLSWEVWGKRFNEYLHLIEKLFYPSLIIIGGGQSKRFDKYRQQLTVRAEVLPATLRNNAGIVGGAIAAKRLVEQHA